jgi:hypothetical protein
VIKFEIFVSFFYYVSLYSKIKLNTFTNLQFIAKLWENIAISLKNAKEFILFLIINNYYWRILEDKYIIWSKYFQINKISKNTKKYKGNSAKFNYIFDYNWQNKWNIFIYICSDIIELYTFESSSKTIFWCMI